MFSSLTAFFLMMVTGWLLIMVWLARRPMPAGLAVQAPKRHGQDLHLLVDHTQLLASGEQQLTHTIFNQVIALIQQANRLILVDMFLFNDSKADRGDLRPLSGELTTALLARKAAMPDITIIVITDPINTLYGGSRHPQFEQLRAAGVEVVETRLTALRDANLAWAACWRPLLSWLGNNPQGGWLPTGLGHHRVTLRSYLALLNFKANHRKVLIVDEGDEWRGLVSSGNPHDASSRHSNMALSFSGPAVADLLATERAVLAFSAPQLLEILPTLPDKALPVPTGGSGVQVVTESAIRDALLEMVESTPAGGELDVLMFYLSHRRVIKALKAAWRRGVNLRVILDPNKDAFGYEKSGIPNRQVAMELTRAGVPVRWYNTRGEQCHSKLLLRRVEGEPVQCLLGSANFTRRNLDNLNLETDVRLWLAGTDPNALALAGLMASCWDPAGSVTLPYPAYRDHSRLRYWRYRLMEATGLSTF